MPDFFTDKEPEALGPFRIEIFGGLNYNRDIEYKDGDIYADSSCG